ncbi:MAG TPA: GNAT family N-acetyltransferase [Caldilineae bacterium]|nr:GNAT family N-acetyltransferase [Caldilineae bacterium]
MTSDAIDFAHPSRQSDAPSAPQEIYIRRSTLHDLNECLTLDASYDTQRVWQMNLDVKDNRILIDFNLVHLPRLVNIRVPPGSENLLRCWQRGDCLLSARRKHTVVGFLHMIPDTPTKVGFIHRHVVEPEFRGQGIGTMLLNHALKWARDHKLRSLVISLSTKNHPASAFYLNRGFVFNGFSEETHGDRRIQLQFARGVR